MDYKNKYNDTMSDRPEFKFYALRYDANKKKVVPFNIFNNHILYIDTLKEVKKYMRNQQGYTYTDHRSLTDEPEVCTGFDGFCHRLDSLIMWQEWSRCEYEMAAGSPFADDWSTFHKYDCYFQAHPNIEIIAREVIYQYKEFVKSNNNKNKKT